MTLERNVEPRSIRIYPYCDAGSHIRLSDDALYFGIGGKNIIKFNGPSGCGIPAAGEQPINTGNKAATNLKINRSPYFSTPLTSAVLLALSPSFSWKRDLRCPFYIPRMNY